MACLAGIVLFPAAMLRFPPVGHTCFTLLLVAAAAGIVARVRPAGFGFLGFVRRYWPLHLAMAGIPLAILINKIALSGYPTGVPYVYLRLALFLPICWILLTLPSGWLKQAQWGFVAGAFISAIWMQIDANSGRPSHVGITNVIPFSNISLIFGVLSLLSIGWQSRHHWLATTLKVLAALAALYASYLSESRGGWVALPILALCGLMSVKRWDMTKKLLIFVLLLSGMLNAYFVTPRVQERTREAVAQVQQYIHGQNPDTSVGVRLQLWNASRLMYRAHPLFGVGLQNFPAELTVLEQKHVISPVAAALKHSHNEILYFTATLGIAGFIAILSLYLVPGFYFFRATRHPDHDIRITGIMGLAVCTGFFVFGLTEVMLIISLTNAFFCLCIATLVAIIVRRQHELQHA